MVALQPLRATLYAAVRRAGVIDVLRLLHLPGGALRPVDAPPGYQLCQLQADELQQLLGEGLAPSQIGQPDSLRQGRHQLVVARTDQRVVSYVWLTRSRVDASENYSRAAHLGTPLQLSPEVVFVHTALTLPEHRGRRLLPALLTWAARKQLDAGERLLTTVDWTNHPSQAAFARVGFQPIGLLWRVGRGPLQVTAAPASLPQLGVQLGDALPGVRLHRRRPLRGRSASADTGRESP